MLVVHRLSCAAVAVPFAPCFEILVERLLEGSASTRPSSSGIYRTDPSLSAHESARLPATPRQPNYLYTIDRQPGLRWAPCTISLTWLTKTITSHKVFLQLQNRAGFMSRQSYNAEVSVPYFLLTRIAVRGSAKDTIQRALNSFGNGHGARPPAMSKVLQVVVH